MRVFPKQKLFYCIIFSLFILSVVVRLPNLNRPLGRHHEWLSSTVLRHQQIWYENGALKYKFLPIMTYNNKADKNINNQASQKDAAGNFYYTSYPPFAYIFPYIIFRAFNIYPDVLPLQIFNIIMHFISCFFIYLIVSLVTRKHYVSRLNIPAILGFAVYLFAPETLWFHSNVYMSDMLVQPFFIIGIYIFLKLIVNEQKPIYYILLGIINFFMIYTEWLGVFFAFSVFLYALVNIKKKAMRRILLIIIITSIASLILTVWQYSQISSFYDFIGASIEKCLFRSGAAQHTDHNLHYWDIQSWRRINRHYVFGYLPFLIVLYAVGFLYFILRKKRFTKNIFHKNRIEIITLYLCLTPVIIHHLLFFNFTAVHDFSVLKDGVFISVLIALFYYRLINILKESSSDKNRILEIKIVNSVIVLMVIFSLYKYRTLNSHNNESYNNIGKEIAKLANNDEVVFIKTKFFIAPQAVFYAHRNIAKWRDYSKAKELLDLNNVERGVIFTLSDKNNRIISKEYINK